MDIALFGSNNPTGASFLQLAKDTSIETWGRKAPINIEDPHVFCDLSENPQDRLKPLGVY